MNAQRDRVFTTLNILNDILEYTGETKLSAYACARTCSKWKEPALDVLWGHMDSFMPLLCLLGQLAIQPTSPKNDKHEYVSIFIYFSMGHIVKSDRFVGFHIYTNLRKLGTFQRQGQKS